MAQNKAVFLFLFSLCSMSVLAQEQSLHADSVQQSKSVQQLQVVEVSAQQILGSKFKARNRTGSAYYISPEEIQRYGYTDINRMLKAVPGVNIYEEDGFGLRPNISLRGTKAERSERITIMEDGILAAPAPYAAPAAYYFPNVARMSAIEVLKGSSQVQYGPFTTGGAINLVSTPVPQAPTAVANISYGSYNTLKLHTYGGVTGRHVGFLVEYLRYQSDGFKKYADRRGKGFDRNDFIGKLYFKWGDPDHIRHAVELKFGFANELSDETYLGLTPVDFAMTPYLRYEGSQVDQMTTRHTQWTATYLLHLSHRLKFTTSAYNNYFHRNWYKLNDVRAGIAPTEKKSIADVLDGYASADRYMDIVTGRTDYDAEALIVRANHRNYRSRGVQTKGEYKLILNDAFLDVEGGLRLHYDEEDRYQWDDSYAMVHQRMQLFLPGIPGTQANVITSATAQAAYLLAKLRYHKWSLTTGVRYEHVSLLKKDYTKKDLRRTGGVRIETPNAAQALIPSLGLHYQWLPSTSFFCGIHKGFAPPSAQAFQKPESSVNMELGTRVYTPRLSAEVIAFYNRYSHMLGSDLAASGGAGTLEQFNVGKADVKGLECLVQYQPLPSGAALQLPLQLTYTYTDTKIKNAFENASWGIVVPGDEIPYIYKHSLNAQVGLTYKWLSCNVGARYNSDMRTQPGQGTIAAREKIPAHLIWDAAVSARINSHITLKVNAINLTNSVYRVSRHPSGVRAGHPLGVYTGVVVRL